MKNSQPTAYGEETAAFKTIQA